MSAIGDIALTLLLLLPAAGPTVADLSPVERAAPDFYHAIAGPGGVTVRWEADRTAVPLDGEVRLTLVVDNAANPGELRKPDPHKLGIPESEFQVLDQSNPGPGRFAYRLRPLAVGTFELPELKYAFYAPGAPEGKRFQTAFADGLTITVTPAAPTATAAVPLDAPEEWFHLAEPRRGWPMPGRLAWLVPVAVVPAAVLAWVVMWRRMYPDAARLAAARRSAAGRAALKQLAAARHAADPAGAAALAVRGYLTTRFGMPAAAETPAEVAAAVRTLSLPPGSDADAERFLRRCDAGRFAPAGDSPLSLLADAERLVVAWEGATA